MPFKLASVFVLALAAATTSGQARDQIQIAGSSTVLPYSSIVAEAFGENFDFPTPVVESGGSSAGLKRFCAGVGENTLDIANSSRPMRETEHAACAVNGVTDIVEVRIGFDGIVFASKLDGPAFSAFDAADFFAALAARIAVNGRVVDNPHRRWSDVNPALPQVDILAFVPGTKHGTREVFEEKLMHAGCRSSGAYQAMLDAGMAETEAENACIELRADGASVDIDGDYTETLARIEASPDAIGVFGLSFFENNRDKLKVAAIGGVLPDIGTVASGAYPVSRPLYFYIKAAHIGVVPGLHEFAMFFVDGAVAGPGGPLVEYGLVPDPDLALTQGIVASVSTM